MLPFNNCQVRKGGIKLGKQITGMKRIEQLIEAIHNGDNKNSEQDVLRFNELLELSDNNNYLYGQALAHIKLANSYYILSRFDAYTHHLELAKSIAERKDYFDVLIEYYNLKGLDYTDECDDLSAISAFLKGAEIALEINDEKRCAIFYNNIAEIFYENQGYEDAKTFYEKALDCLEGMEDESIPRYRKTILMNLINVACYENNVKEAKRYLKECQAIVYENGIIPFLESVSKIRIAILEQKKEEASKLVDALIEALANQTENVHVLQTVYLYLLETAIAFRRRNYASWCLNKIDTLYKETNPSVTMKIAKLRNQYYETFEIENDTLYEDFYNLTQENEAITNAFTVESFKGYISLYEAKKEQRRILQEQESLQDIADKDELTQLYNRRYYNKLVSKYTQDDRIHTLAYMMIDVDYFKEYNDYYGHAQGDMILRTIANALKNNLPSDSYAARYGGDEFSCLFVNKQNEELVDFIHRVQAEIMSQNIEHVKNRIANTITMSFGVCNEDKLANHNWDEFQLIKNADDALYQAKQKGRNTYVVFGVSDE